MKKNVIDVLTEEFPVNALEILDVLRKMSKEQGKERSEEDGIRRSRDTETV